MNGEQVTTRRPTLTIRNSEHNIAVGFVSYVFVVARDQAFTQVVASGSADEGTASTAWTVDRDLDYGIAHYWRVRAHDDLVTTDWTTTEVFRTSAAPAPVPGPAPGPSNPGGACVSGNPQTIVECERAKYGHMSTGQMLQFMRAVAQSLNRNGISGGPFGILRKAGGHNCGGYSCDVICAGQGGSQRQWDVLGDIDGDQTPGWGGPNSGSDIRVDVCEIQ